ncbi:protein halfway isoform X2 [Tribolium castaneum]|uniref:protein halfway isoform X2 n=1 Tax=Tribolium castaneum TaxID=7070 RepID=UPI00046BF004|nr:PREDICTED: protein halfway isoform X2 [Tribolium castaneum]|eukprot:XP_967806.3 PREDICTED: protein halfway isoform X2 [Tribolium castaneum]
MCGLIINMWKTLSILLLCLLLEPSWSRLAEDITYSSLDNCVTDHCFHQPAEACPSPDSKCRCRKLPYCKSAAVCCNVNKFQLTEGLACANISGNGHVESLHIRNASLDILNVEDWRKLKYLRYMTITDGQINSVVGEFAKHTIVSCLNLSSNGIVNFENRSLVNLYNLSFLDLSHNNLSDVPRFKKDGNITLDISANQHMLCSNLFDALKRTELHFSNINNSFCLFARTFHWFNTTETVPLTQVIGTHKLRKDCRKNCTCEPSRLDLVSGKQATIAVAVNCSGQSWTSLPSPLPPNTIALNVSNNNITSLELFSTDSSYQNIRELYADNNQITSILPLEGSQFLSSFAVLSLRNNKLKSLPTYIFSNILDRNNYVRYVFLGLNRLQCDCNTAKVLKVWLLTKQKNIPDFEEIYCDNMDMKVIDLNPSKLCQTQQDWTDYIYYIITIEVVLLVGLIAKVVYDYCVFKTSGYLPWPASKMPKLPCDWLCE